MYLLLDRSSPIPAAILRDGGKTVARISGCASQMRQPLQGSELKKLLADNRIAPGDLECAVCGLGPGSFSGIRSVLSALIGLTLPFNKPLYGISSAIACAAATGRTGYVSVIGDARRNRLWHVTYLIGEDGSVLLQNGQKPSHTAADFTLAEPAALCDSIPGDAFVVSPDFARLKSVLTEKFEARLLQDDARPDIEAMARVFENAPGNCPVNPAPIYLQPAVSAPPCSAQ